MVQVTAANGDRHYLTPAGLSYQSVTTFLDGLPKPYLDDWIKRKGKVEAERIANAAAERGRDLHDAVEHYLRNDPLKKLGLLQQRLFNQIKSSVNCIDNIRLIEKPLYSNKLKLAGTPDVIADYAAKFSVIDLKTSIKLKVEDWIIGYYCQTAAYAIMYNELYGVMPEKSVIIMAVEESHLPQVWVKDMSECVQLLKQYAAKLIEHRYANTLSKLSH